MRTELKKALFILVIPILLSVLFFSEIPTIADQYEFDSFSYDHNNLTIKAEIDNAFRKNPFGGMGLYESITKIKQDYGDEFNYTLRYYQFSGVMIDRTTALLCGVFLLIYSSLFLFQLRQYRHKKASVETREEKDKSTSILYSNFLVIPIIFVAFRMFFCGSFTYCISDGFEELYYILSTYIVVIIYVLFTLMRFVYCTKTLYGKKVSVTKALVFLIPHITLVIIFYILLDNSVKQGIFFYNVPFPLP